MLLPPPSMTPALLPTLSVLVALFFIHSEAGGIGGEIGINYGRVADDLPSPARAVELMKSLNVGRVKLFDANPQVLSALADSGLKVVVGVKNEEISELARHPAAAETWVRRIVLAFSPSTQIRLVNVGNEVLSNHSNTALWYHLLPAMKNIYKSLANHKLSGTIKVTTSVAMDALYISYPPSAGMFRKDIARPILKPMLHFLSRTNSYFFLNVYPYFAWAANRQLIPLEYVLFETEGVVVEDGGRKYSDMLSAQLDATIAAMEKLGYSNVRLAISETGWPSKGDPDDEAGANLLNAAAYNQRLVRRLFAKNPVGTPKRPGKYIPAHIFSLFDEDHKPGPATERNWGLLYSNGSRKYYADLTGNIIGEQYPQFSTALPQLPVLPTPAAKPSPSSQHPSLPVTPVPSPRNTSLPRRSSPSTPSTPYQIIPSFPAKLPSAWCVVNSTMDKTLVQEAMEVACSFGGADCRPIQQGKACFQPNSLQVHASYAFNNYWQKTKHLGGTCTFAGAAMLTHVNPSYEGCIFEYRD